jgi:hypothetical protein
VNATQDAAHAVKLLRLRSLLPESLLLNDIGKVISALEMSHWDVARAAGFLLDSDKAKGRSARPEFSSTRRSSNLYNANYSNSNQVFNNNDSNDINNSNEISSYPNSTGVLGHAENDNIRPTRV